MGKANENTSEEKDPVNKQGSSNKEGTQGNVGTPDKNAVSKEGDTLNENASQQSENTPDDNTPKNGSASSNGGGTVPEKEDNSSKNATPAPTEGSFYIVDGALFTCSYGNVINRIVSKNKKVFVQNKPVISEDDKMFPAPFGTCAGQTTPSGPPPCNGFAKLEWEKDDSFDKKTKLPTENSKLQCKCPSSKPGEITCLFPGQMQQVSPKDIEDFEVENIDEFLKNKFVKIENSEKKSKIEKFEVNQTKVFRLDPEEKELIKKKDKKIRITIRKGERLKFKAYKNTKNPKEITNRPLSWVVYQLDKKKISKKVKGKNVIEEKEKIANLHIYSHVVDAITLSMPKAGVYVVEGMGNSGKKRSFASLSKYEGFVNNINIGKDVFTDSFVVDEPCTLRFEVKENNSIIGFLNAENKNFSVSEDNPIYLKQGREMVIKTKLEFPFDSNKDIMKCSVTKKNGEAVLSDDYVIKENNLQLTLHPSDAEIDYKIKFELFKRGGDGTQEISVSSKYISVHSYNDVVLNASVSSWVNNNEKDKGNVTLRRPNDTLAFSIKKNDEIDFSGLDNVQWTIKEEGIPVQYAKGSKFAYKFEDEGIYLIEADLSQTKFSNGGIEGVGVDNNKGDCKKRTITHKLEISHNKVIDISVGSTSYGVRYVGVKYPIDLKFYFGDFTALSEINNVQLTVSGGDVDNYLLNNKSGRMFMAKKPGTYKIKAKLGEKVFESQEIKVLESTFIRWEFCDSKNNTISRIGKGLKFGFRAYVPAWGLINGENQTQSRKIKIALFVMEKMVYSVYTELDESGKFSVKDIDVEKDVINNAKKNHLQIGTEFAIGLVVFECPSSYVKGLSKKEPNGLFSYKMTLTVTDKFSIDGYFADSEGKKLVRILKYGDEAKVHLKIFNASKSLLNAMTLRVYENESLIDDKVFEQKGITLDSDGCADILIPTNDGGIKESDHDGSLPRLFYFRVLNSGKGDFLVNKFVVFDGFYQLFIYPQTPGELYDFNVMEKMSGLQDEAIKECGDKKYNSKILDTARNYYYQLKLLPKESEDKNYVNSYNSFAPVLVGKDWGSSDFCEGKNCITMANYASKNAGELIKEINVRLAGFGKAGMPLPTQSFDFLTVNAIKQFQRDVMGVVPTGRICGSLLKAIDDFCENKDYDFDFDELKCPCVGKDKDKPGGKCGGFGKGRTAKDGKKEHPGMHRSLLFALKTFLFYLRHKEFGKRTIIGAENKNEDIYYRLLIVFSSYRCINDNERQVRNSTNHMGNALDLHFYILQKDDYEIKDGKIFDKLDSPYKNGVADKEVKKKLGETNRAKKLEQMNWIREKIFIDRMGAQYLWPKKNKISLEDGDAKDPSKANTWVHFDVRELNDEYQTDDFYIKDKNSLCPKKLVDMAKELGLDLVCNCMSTKPEHCQQIADLAVLDNDGRKPISDYHVSDNKSLIEFIKSYESFSKDLYDDSEGHATIGYGNKLSNKSVKNLTAAEKKEFSKHGEKKVAEEDFQKHLKLSEEGVKKSIKADLHMREFEALVSLCYNCGPNFLDKGGANKGNTQIKMNINAGKYDEGAEEMRNVTNHNTPGLVIRRGNEITLFMTGVYTLKNGDILK
ncbi:MAG TPA: PAAR-like protein [Paludibacteraceae bacterium]|nr:PAAR-like protein [Paludibacteraceae bacterium]